MSLSDLMVCTGDDSDVLNFGRHRGKSIQNVPDDYLRWCLKNITNLNPALRTRMQNHLDETDRSQEIPREILDQVKALTQRVTQLQADLLVCETAKKRALASYELSLDSIKMLSADVVRLKAELATRKGGPPAVDIRSVVKRWYRALVIRFHPDRGGSDVQAVVVTCAYQSLMQEIEKWEQS